MPGDRDATLPQQVGYTAADNSVQQQNQGSGTPMKALFSLLGSLLVGGLVLLGIGGVAYHLFREDGWLSQGMGALWEAHYQAPVLTIILIIAAFFVFRTLYTAQIGGKRDSKIPDFVLFAFIAVGIFFFGRWLTTGSI
jgi:hypothetical protein